MESGQKGALILLSGGQDSATCLALMKRNFKYPFVDALSFCYGQRHEMELLQAKRIGKIFEVRKHDTVDLKNYGALLDSALTGYSFEKIEESKRFKGLPTSFVPGRNMVFFSIAAGVAVSRGIEHIYSGVCQADSSGYPDCRYEFVAACEDAINFALGLPKNTVRLFTPLINMTKARIFEAADELGVLETILTETATCYNTGLGKHSWGHGCGKCPACLLRKKGWEEFCERQKA